MNSLWTRIIIETLKRQNHNKKNGQVRFSEYELAKGVKIFKIAVIRLIKDILLLMAGIISAGFGLKGFLLPNGFVDGGAVGISLLIAEVTKFSFPILLILVNLPFIIMGFRVIGKGFAIKTIVAIAILAVVVTIVPYPEITDDKLLVAVFGGFFLGAGIGLAIRGGGVIDGTEVFAIFTSRRTSLSIGDVILIMNIIIFSFAAYLLSIEVALYSVLTYLAASKTVDFIVEGIDEYTGVTIISVRNERIKQMIIEKLGRGLTVYQGKSGYGKSGEKKAEMDIIYTVVTRLEISKLKGEIAKIDPHAFVLMSSVKETKGGMIKKRPLK